jgi:hypothetical protein
MIIEYKTSTKDITAAHYGRAWANADWADYETNNPGYAVIEIAQENVTSVYKKYLQINDGVGTLHDSSDMGVSVSATPDSNNIYSLVSNDTAYIDFTNVPEGAIVTVDETSVGTMDSSGTFRFKAQDAGMYNIAFALTAYEPINFTVVTSDNP